MSAGTSFSRPSKVPFGSLRDRDMLRMVKIEEEEEGRNIKSYLSKAESVGANTVNGPGPLI